MSGCRRLRLVCCTTAPDNEKLAAIGRLSAIVAAHNLDWDRALANGNGAALTEQQMSHIYAEGYSRGHADGVQQTRPARDWTPAAGTSSEIGDDAERLEAILKAAAQCHDAGLLSEWEVGFSNDMRDRFETYGNRMYVTNASGQRLTGSKQKCIAQEYYRLSSLAWCNVSGKGEGYVFV